MVTNKELPLDGPTNPSSGLRNEVIEKIEKTQELAPKRRGRPPKVRIDLDSGTNPTNNLVETTETLRPRRGRPPKLATSLGSEILTPILTTRKRGRPRKITNLEHDIREENS